jgi:hypothetical protein
MLFCKTNSRCNSGPACHVNTKAHESVPSGLLSSPGRAVVRYAFGDSTIIPPV